MARRTQPVYIALAAVWGLVVLWQVFEHRRVRESARATLINRSEDISTTLGLVIRSQRRGGGVISQERMENTLNALLKFGELKSVALLNASGNVVISVGAPLDLDATGVLQTGERWDRAAVTLVNLIDLGAGVAREGETNRPTIILPPRDTNALAGPPPDGRERGRFGPPPEFMDGTNAPPFPPPGFTNGFAARGWRPPPRRMSDEEYQNLLKSRGLHGLAIAMATDTFRRTCVQDLWVRVVIGCFAGVSALGFGIAWRNIVKSAQLQMRLVRASELTSHLKEMNLAAAGLAHETRNPLNIIRGLAQMISRRGDASAEVQEHSRDIITETDRVTAQLNEFINYSRPREVRRVPVTLRSVAADVARALSHDLDEKDIDLSISEAPVTVEADEQLVRQALFNLVLNAIQAATEGGEIRIVASEAPGDEAAIEIRDNGPGVLPEHRTEVFKPYFTTQPKGTGLGLAVVQQIVRAHGWEIECVPNDPKGAIFRIRGMRVTSKNPDHAS